MSPSSIPKVTRYQTTAERTFHRALARLRSFHKDYLAAQLLEQKSEAPKPTPLSKPSLKRDLVLHLAPQQAVRFLRSDQNRAREQAFCRLCIPQ
jgi:site-specific recombinase XerD